jgi:HlyD family secretion protein
MAPKPLSETPWRARLQAHRIGVVLVLTVLLALGAWGLSAWRGPLVLTETVLRRDLVQTIVASGHVEAPNRLLVAAQITGTVRRVPVMEGQAVSAGALLVELESAELRATELQSQAALGQAQARLRALQEVQGPVAAQALRQAQATRDNAHAALLRSQALFQQGFIGQAALDEARKASELAHAQLQASQQQLAATGPTGSARALALADVAGAQANAQAAQVRAGYAALHAPVDGLLIARSVEVGDVVQPGKTLMTVSPRGLTQLVLQIDEKNLALLALGQQALASADAYASQRFAATLAYINPGINASTGAVEVKLNVPAPPAALMQDMTVSVDLEVARRPQVLTLPLAAVREPDSTAPWVLRVDGHHLVRRPVRLGLRSGGVAEVIEGLAEGDRVAAAPATWAAGARVRVRDVAASSPL